MAPMRDSSFLKYLASSTNSFQELILFFESWKADELSSLNALAISSLTNPDDKALALKRLGRVDMLDSIIHHLSRYLRGKNSGSRQGAE